MKAFMYISRAQHQGSAPWMPHDFVNLISTSRRNNAKHAITGFLCYQDGYFLQYLEGPERSMETLLVKVLNDTRHIEAHILLNEGITERSFSKWSMPIGNKIAKDEEFLNFTKRNQALFSEQLDGNEEILRNFHVYDVPKTEGRFRHAVAASSARLSANTVYDQVV